MPQKHTNVMGWLYVTLCEGTVLCKHQIFKARNKVFLYFRTDTSTFYQLKQEKPILVCFQANNFHQSLGVLTRSDP